MTSSVWSPLPEASAICFGPCVVRAADAKIVLPDDAVPFARPTRRACPWPHDECSSPDVGVVGYTLGGGMGWLARSHGFAANSVLAVELVTADGRLVRADRENDPDLF